MAEKGEKEKNPKKADLSRTAEILSRNILDKVLGVQNSLSREVRKIIRKKIYAFMGNTPATTGFQRRLNL